MLNQIIHGVLASVVIVSVAVALSNSANAKNAAKLERLVTGKDTVIGYKVKNKVYGTDLYQYCVLYHNSCIDIHTGTLRFILFQGKVIDAGGATVGRIKHGY